MIDVAADNRGRAALGTPSAPPDDDMRSLAALIAEIREARQRMSASNSHRTVLEQCAVALSDLAVQLHQATTRAQRQQALVVDVLADMRAVVAQKPAGEDVVTDGLFNVIDAWAEALAPIEVS